MHFPRKVYAIQHNITGKIYVGSTKDVADRYKRHISALRAGRHSNKEMQSDFDKYGENYTVFVLDDMHNNSERTLEREWMCRLHTYDSRIGYNSSDPYFRNNGPTISITFAKGIPTPNKM